ncbi:MAG: LPXTG cell wall anchor domain-containing protein [Ruminococcus sp.]|nr:LPXTG cell wall anchor domain-containing protein [Ruminococcus sp.]
MNKISSIVNDIFARKKISRHFTIIVICLSVLVTYAVSSMLIMPAESVNGKLICDITEHVHSDECYELVCTQNALKQTEISLLESISQTSVQTTADITSETTETAETAVTTEVITSQTTLTEVTDKSQISETALLSETSEIAVIASEETTDISVTESQTETTVSETSVPDTVTSEVSVTETTTAHVHTDECYELICQFEYHVHSDKCYEGGEGAESINLPGFSHNLGRPLLNDIVTTGLADDIVNGGVYKIKNKNSGLYLEVASDTAKNNVNIQQNNYTGTRNHFKLVDQGNGYWKIYTCLNENDEYALNVSGESAGDGANIAIYSSKAGDNQQFKFIKHDEDGTYSMLTKITSDASCVEVFNHSKEVGGNINQYKCYYNEQTSYQNNNQKFYLEPVVETTGENIKIEARVIFGDYNDDGTHEYTNVYPNLQLKYRHGGSWDILYGEKVTATLVEDNTSARKDWCYQYKYTWSVPKIAYGSGENSTNTGYYASIDFEGKENYNIYYLPEKYFGSPGASVPGTFKNVERHTFFNEDGVIYIFLDPKVDWSCPVYDDGTVKPNNFNLTMKKRWDGHNQGSLKQIAHHKNEKIQIQLQRRNDNGEFSEYVNYDYYNYHYYNDPNGNFIDSRDVAYFTDESLLAEKGYQITFGDETIYYKDPKKGYIDKTSLAIARISPPKEYRLKIYYGYDRWNNVVLTLNGDNLPSHFTNGYYYIWNDLPYGMYRVIETRSFIDINDNDKFDEGTDIDTSPEYYYMTYPPARDSKGVLHIQNFTSEMKLSVHKEWYGDEDCETYIPYEYLSGDNKFFSPEVVVELYRSIESGVPVSDGSGYTVNGETLYSVWKTTINGSQKVDIPSSYLDMYDSTGNKYYYYIREDTNATFRCLNANEYGFVKAQNGSYGVPYDEGPENRAFVIKNTPEMQIVVNKQWIKNEHLNTTNLVLDNYNAEVEFEVYRSKSQISGLNNPFEEKKYSYSKKEDPGIDFVSIVSSLEKMKNVDGNDYFVTSNQTFALTNDNCIDFDTYYVDTDNTIKPYYYYIKEKNTDNYLHAIYSNNGIYNGSSNKTVLIQNVPMMRFEVEKVWYKEDGTTVDTNNKDEVTFWVLRSTNTSAKNDNGKDITKDENNGGIASIYKRGPFTTTNLKYTLPTYDSFYVPYKVTKNEDGTYTATGQYYFYIVEVKDGDDTYIQMDSVHNGKTAVWYNNYLCFTSQGTLQLQNKPNAKVENLTIDVTKKWYISSNGAEIPNATINMPVKFELYRSTNQGTPTASNDGYYVNGSKLEQITNSTFTIDENGQATVNSALLKRKDDSGNKYYYYIREVQSENFDCINNDPNNLGFVHNDSNVYGIAYADNSTSISFTIKNVPQIKIKVDKKWFDSDGNVDTENNNEMQFVLLRASADYGQNLSISTDNNGDYYVSGTSKTFRTVGTFTTENLSKTLTINDSGDIVPYKTNSKNEIQKLYFYVLEINGDNYNTDNYTVRVLNQAVSWDKDKDCASISVINMPNLSLNLEKQWEGNPEMSEVKVLLYRSTDRTKAPQNSIIKDSQTAVERSTVTFSDSDAFNSYKVYNYQTADFTKEILLANNNVEKVVVKIPTNTGYPYIIVHLNDNEYIKVGRYNGGDFVYESNATQMPTGSFSISNGYLEVDCTKLQQGVEDAIYIQNASDNPGEYEITIYYQTDTVSSTRSLLIDESANVSSDVETVGTYTLTSSENWQKTISNLPVCDANYAPYYYWIVEESIDSSIESVSYRFVDNDPDTVYCVNAMSPGSSATLIVKNKLKVILPETGSSGTTNYYIIGGVLLTVGLLSRCFIKRKT